MYLMLYDKLVIPGQQERLHWRWLPKASFLHIEGDRMLWVCPVSDTLFRRREVVLPVLSVVLAIGAARVELAQRQRSA